MGDASDIRLAALDAAARLVQRPDDRDALVGTALELLRNPEHRAAGAALFVLHKKGAYVDIRSLAESSNPALRQLAAALWCIDSDDEALGAQLADDPDRGVRRELARGVRRLASTRPERTRPLLARLAADASAEIRGLAAFQEPDEIAED
jgi:hypothetical protein